MAEEQEAASAVPNIEQGMTSEQLYAAGKELKKLYNRARKKSTKIEERFVSKLKELQQSNKLIEENERTIEALEQEIQTAKTCLNLVFRNDPNSSLFSRDVQITLDLCMNLCADLKNTHQDEIEKARQQGFQNASNGMEGGKDEAEELDNQALMSVLLEESSNLKARIIQLTEQNNSIKLENKRLTMTAGAEFRETIERQKEEIRTLKMKVFEHSSQQGLQLLNALGAPSKQSNQTVVSLQKENTSNL